MWDCFSNILHFNPSYHTTCIITFAYETKIGMDLPKLKSKAVQILIHYRIKHL